MPKLRCRCGYVHNLSPSPDHGWHAIPDTSLDKLIDDPNPEVRDATFSRHALTFYECPECGRIAWERADKQEFVFYTRESDPESTV